MEEVRFNLMRKFQYILITVIFLLFVVIAFQSYNNASIDTIISTFSLTGLLMCIFMLVEKGKIS